MTERVKEETKAKIRKTGRKRKKTEWETRGKKGKRKL